MKRRLRKKRHLGEFRQLGFSIRIAFRPGLTVDALHRFAEAFVIEAIEGSSLEFSGGGGIRSGLRDSPSRDGSPEVDGKIRPSVEWDWNGVICRAHRNDSTTDEDVEAVRKWALQQNEVLDCCASEHWDVWHGIDPFGMEFRVPKGDEAGVP